MSTLSHSMGTVAVHGVSVAEGWSVEFLESLNVPLVQAIACTSSQQEWQQNSAGLTPLDTAMTVAMPEFDGRIISVPFSFKEVVAAEGMVGSVVTRYVPVPDRVQTVVGLAARLARLRHTPNAAKRVAIMLSSYPTKTARIGNAVGLDSPASLLHLLQALHQAGYDLGVEPLPPDSDSLIQALIASGTYDTEFLTDEQLRGAPGQVRAAEYQDWYERWPGSVQNALRDAWGAPPGTMYRHNGALAVVGLQFGNIFVGIQPPRGFGDNPIAIYHNSDLVPSHHYLGSYHWLRHAFRADALVHMGKHGTLEWLPGKSIGLSAACYPDLALGDLGYAYTGDTYGAEASSECKARFAAMTVAVQNQDNREHDIFDSGDYLQYHGGMVATVRALTGHHPKAYIGDSSDPTRSRVRELADESRRVFRTRVVNPKWIQSMQRHGYKGAFEMAATVDYLFGYDATSHVVEDWMYARLTDQYVLDPQVQQFFQEKNPWALRTIIERLLEAVQRQLWEHPDQAQLEQMRQIYLQLEGELEERTETP